MLLCSIGSNDGSSSVSWMLLLLFMMMMMPEIVDFFIGIIHWWRLNPLQWLLDMILRWNNWCAITVTISRTAVLMIDLITDTDTAICHHRRHWSGYNCGGCYRCCSSAGFWHGHGPSSFSSCGSGGGQGGGRGWECHLFLGAVVAIAFIADTDGSGVVGIVVINDTAIHWRWQKHGCWVWLR